MYRWILTLGIICVGALLGWRGSVVPLHVVRIGVTAGPHAMIVEDVKARMMPHGIDIKIIEFNDFHMPNTALDAGEVDLNIYQHEPFLKEDCLARGFKLRVVGKSVLMPMGLYSKRYKKMEDLPQNARIALPNDPTNRDRAKALCAEMNLTKADFIEVDAPQLPRSLDDVDAALIPTDWVVLAQMDAKSALYHENAQKSPYTNVIVAREDMEMTPDIQSFLAYYQSNETKKFIEQTFNDALLPGWVSVS